MELVQSEGETEGRRERQGEEGMAFRVTRHTPRNLRSGQRRVLTPESSLILSGKRMKLDHASASVPATSKGLTLSCFLHVLLVCVERGIVLLAHV